MSHRTCRALTLAGVCALTAWGLAAPPARGQLDNEWSPDLELDLNLPPPPQQPPRLLKVAQPGAFPAPEDPRYSANLTVIPELDKLESSANTRFRLDLLDDTTVILVRERIKKRPGGLVWYGSIEGEPASDVILSVADDALSGSIHSIGHLTHVISRGEGQYHWLRQIDPEFTAPEAPAFRHQTLPPHLANPRACADPATEIDVMVLYTSGARNLDVVDSDYPPIDVSAMEADIYRYIGETNESFLNSDVVTRVKLVHVEQIQFDDHLGRPMREMAAALRTDSNVINLRQTYGADIVVLLVSPNHDDPGGTEFWNETPSDSSDEDAYCVAMRTAAESQLTVTHEIGHVLGAEHECGGELIPLNDPGLDHGKVLADPDDAIWRGTTIMATEAPSNRQLYFSRPGTIPGTSIELGTTSGVCTADNRRAINAADQYVARYRCSSPGRSDVWMKDTWNDTGDEPTPLAIGDVLWDSPYIWIRNEQDPTRVHQHQHQNPEAGGTSWIYVKLNNGGSADRTGELKLYWADSALNSTWSGGWTQIGHAIPVTVPASSSVLAEGAWPVVPPASESICLLARWESLLDPMSEGPSVYLNVLNSNNIIWKNLTIVDIPVFRHVFDARIIIRNPPDPEREELRRIRIGVAPPPEGLLDSFIRVGRVRIRFDDVLMSAWLEAGSQGNGYRPDGDGFLLTRDRGASFNLALPAAAEGRATISFESLDTTPNADYRIDVTQGEGDEIVGGASYELRVGARAPDARPSEPEEPASDAPGQ